MNQIDPTDPHGSRIGEILVKEGLARQQDIDAALDIQAKEKESDPSVSTTDGERGECQPAAADSYPNGGVDDRYTGTRTIGEILCHMGIISPVDLNHILIKYDKRLKLGGVLTKMGITTHTEIEKAMASQRHSAKPLGQILVEQDVISDNQRYRALSKQHNISLVMMDGFQYPDDQKVELIQAIGRNYADENAVLPLSIEGSKLTVGVFSPESIQGVEALRNVYAYLRVDCVFITHGRFDELFESLYGCKPVKALKRVSPHPSPSDRDGEPERRDVSVAADRRKPDIPSDQDMEALLRYLLAYGITREAESIHIEQTETGGVVRYRIDGALQELNVPEMRETLPRFIGDLIHKLKELADIPGMDADTPQTGRMRMSVSSSNSDGRMPVDFKVSILPSLSGPIVTLTAGSSPISEIGDLKHSVYARAAMGRLLASPSGIILIVGPKESGREETMAGVLKHLQDPGKRILLASESKAPDMEGVLQVQTNPGRISHEQSIHAFMAHDPDIIAVDTIRDMPTVEAVFDAAHLGPLLVCGMDAEDSADALWRLMALGIDRERIARSVNGIVAQQGVRRICMACRTRYVPETEEWNDLFHRFPTRLTFYKGGGCSRCRQTGFDGRITLSEVLVIEEALACAIRAGGDQVEFRRIAGDLGMKTMVDDGLLKLKQTTLNEIVRSIPFKMIMAHQHQLEAAPPLDARKPSRLKPSFDDATDRPMKYEWIVSSPRSQRSLIREMYDVYRAPSDTSALCHPGPVEMLFFDFVQESFQEICREHHCRHVLFTMESRADGFSFWAAPVSVG